MNNLLKKLKFNLSFVYYKINFLIIDIIKIILNINIEPILIYQMGKVGSSSVYHTLKHLKLGVPIIHCHFISEKHIKEIESYYKSINKENHHSLMVTKKIGKFLREKINSNKYRWKIITLVRDPIARDCSDFTHNLLRDYNDINYNVSKKNISLSVKELELKFINFDSRFDYTIQWFDNEMKTVFDFDVYSKYFNKERGYTIYHENDKDILILKLESLNTIFGKAFKEFLGVDNITMYKANIGENKIYRDFYKTVLIKLKIPEEIQSKIYSSKYASHFYTSEQILAFKHRLNRSKL